MRRKSCIYGGIAVSLVIGILGYAFFDKMFPHKDATISFDKIIVGPGNHKQEFVFENRTSVQFDNEKFREQSFKLLTGEYTLQLRENNTALVKEGGFHTRFNLAHNGFVPFISFSKSDTQVGPFISGDNIFLEWKVGALEENTENVKKYKLLRYPYPVIRFRTKQDGKFSVSAFYDKSCDDGSNCIRVNGKERYFNVSIPIEVLEIKTE